MIMEAIRLRSSHKLPTLARTAGRELTLKMQTSSDRKILLLSDSCDNSYQYRLDVTDRMGKVRSMKHLAKQVHMDECGLPYLQLKKRKGGSRKRPKKNQGLQMYKQTFLQQGKRRG